MKISSNFRHWTLNFGLPAISYRLLVLSYLLFATSLVQAQLVAVPVSQSAVHKYSNARVQALALPFFDDFSLAKNNTPDPALWVNGGTYVNNTLTVNHPTINVVTFDGANAAGRPYSSNLLAQGSTDTLTSQAIDLSKLSPVDSVYLSFYWQAKGNGELPDDTDSLHVLCLNDKGLWIKVWKQVGKISSAFDIAMLLLKDKSFYHANFQFRFQAIGRRSGAFDTWHIDYVYLNKNRRLNDRFVKDIACRQAVTPFLKRYSAMPLHQYFANASAETADSVATDIQNLFTVFNSTTFNYTVTNAATKAVYQSFRDTDAKFITALAAQAKRVKLLPLPKTLETLKKLTIISKFQVITTDTTSIAGIDLKRNDSISTRTVFDDYYAYDDGSAEFGVYMSKALGRTAMRYVVNKPDTVKGVYMNIMPILADVSGKPFTVQLFGNDKGKPGRLLYQESFKAQYPAGRNNVVPFEFQYGTAVKDTFFVGWQQIGPEPIAVGLDRNTPREQHIFVNLGQEWAPYTDFKNDANLIYFTGSLMIRPMMGYKKLPDVTAIAPLADIEWIVFPNPTQGVIEWMPNEAKRIEIWNTAGALVQQKQLNISEKNIDLRHLPDGSYIIRLSNEQKSVMKKILLKK